MRAVRAVRAVRDASLGVVGEVSVSQRDGAAAASRAGAAMFLWLRGSSAVYLYQ